MRALLPFRWKLLLSFVLGLGTVVLSLAFVWISERVVDIATGSMEASLVENIVTMVAIMLLQIMFALFNRYFEEKITIGARNDRLAFLFSRVMKSTWTGRDEFHSADTVNRLEEDVQVTTDFICSVVPAILVTLFQFAASATYLFIRQPKLAWILLFIMPVAVVGSRLFFRTMRRISGDIRKSEGLVQSHVQENIQHRMLVAAMENSEKVFENLDSMQCGVRSLYLSRAKYSAASNLFIRLGFSAGYATVFIWGVLGIKEGTVSYGMMVALLQLVGQVQRPVANLARQLAFFIKALASEERLIELEVLPQESAVTPVMFSSTPGVKLEGLTFSYPDSGKKVLDGLDFDFKPGTMTIVCGPTGSGKSTLARLMLSLLKPSGGNISLYDDSGSHPADASTRCNFMYVPQGNSLMSGSIRDNLLMADRNASEEDLRRALHIAAADFVFSLDKGLDTTCSEVGGGLSEGQAQRIAIARGLLRPGGILVLDEASSALDAETEAILLERLSNNCRGRKTIVFITHRSSADNIADGILRL